MSVNYYEYQACDAQGNIINGQLSADSEREAIAMLQAKKLVPVKLKITSKQNLQRSGGKIKNADLVDFTSGLTTLVEARIPIDKALSLLEGITEKEHMKRLVVSLRRDVKEGKSLADAMEARPEVFSRLYYNIVRAGETGGILDQLLPDLSHFLENAEETKKQIISALTYPLVLFITGLISVVLLLVYVVPQFTAMFEDVGSDIPPSAEFLLSLSAGLQNYGWLIVPVVFGIGYWWRWLNADKQRKRPKGCLYVASANCRQIISAPRCGNIFTNTGRPAWGRYSIDPWLKSCPRSNQ